MGVGWAGVQGHVVCSSLLKLPDVRRCPDLLCKTGSKADAASFEVNKHCLIRSVCACVLLCVCAHVERVSQWRGGAGSGGLMMAAPQQNSSPSAQQQIVSAALMTVWGFGRRDEGSEQ